MQDLNIKDLPLVQQKEEQAYQAFIRENKTNKVLTFVPYILIQLLLSTLIFGIFGNKLSIWKLALHFSINSIPTSIGITYLINSGILFKGVGVMIMVMAINYLSLLLIHRFKKCVYY